MMDLLVFIVHSSFLIVDDRRHLFWPMIFLSSLSLGLKSMNTPLPGFLKSSTSEKSRKEKSSSEFYFISLKR